MYICHICIHTYIYTYNMYVCVCVPVCVCGWEVEVVAAAPGVRGGRGVRGLLHARCILGQLWRWATRAPVLRDDSWCSARSSDTTQTTLPISRFPPPPPFELTPTGGAGDGEPPRESPDQPCSASAGNMSMPTFETGVYGTRAAGRSSAPVLRDGAMSSSRSSD
jgi:hypothetical protein